MSTSRYRGDDAIPLVVGGLYRLLPFSTSGQWVEIVGIVNGVIHVRGVGNTIAAWSVTVKRFDDLVGEYIIPSEVVEPVEPDTTVLVYASIPSDINLARSNDSGLTFTDYVLTDAIGVSLPIVASVNDRLYSMADGRASYTNDGLSFNTCSGMSGFTGANGMLYTGSEYILWNSTANMKVSTDGLAFSNRANGLGYTQSMAKKGDVIVATSSSSSTASRSTDNGATWATFTLATGTRRIIATESWFVVSSFFGVVLRSQTGASGTWSTVTVTGAARLIRMAQSTDGRIVAVDQLGATFYSDDEGATWAAGAPTLALGSWFSDNSQEGYMVYADQGFLLHPNVDNPDRIFRSADGVEPWTLVDAGGNWFGNLAVIAPHL